MNFSEYLTVVNGYFCINYKERFGQACFNVLYDIDSEYALTLGGTELDPFFDDNVVPEFLCKVRDYFG
jgi:hypothetical protein